MAASLAIYILFLVIGSAALAEPKACPVAPIPEDPNFAMALNNWYKKEGAKVTPDDLACCLPKVYRDNYVVAHSSISAQMSHYHNPRVIMFDPIRRVFISISGGDPDLPQSTNMEIFQATDKAAHA